jgi:outer membrane receptor for monomeric catechols
MDQCFDAETTALICRVFDDICVGQETAVRETIARRIIEIAGRGERDPRKMGHAVLASIGLVPNRFTVSPFHVRGVANP